MTFITQVTNDRIGYLESTKNLDIFWETLRNVQKNHPFKLLAYVILPDHFHFLMRVDDDHGDFSKIMHSLKRNFTINFKRFYSVENSATLWQRGFWDHIIRDENDLEKHFDYIHWNPVKHGYVKLPEDWQQSTYNFWCKKGFYEGGWGADDVPENIRGVEFE